MYEFGEGISKSDSQAVYWYEKSADLGYWEGQLNLARKFMLGEGVARDTVEGLRSIESLASSGNPEAQILLTTIYSSALPFYGIEKDDAKALYWCRLAAEQGFDLAEGMLGHFYRHGIGVKENQAKAEEWLYRAGEGDAEAQYELAIIFETSKGNSEEHSAESIKWLKRAAFQGHARAQYALGRAFMKGYGVDQDYKKGLQWLILSAKQGNSYAENFLGVAFRNGLGVVRDPQEALYWYTRAATQGNLRAAQYNLGRVYEYGAGIEKNEELAIQWYQRAASQGHYESLQKLAEHGIRMSKNTVVPESTWNRINDRISSVS
jgi:TPR repeat protein